jgi:hypothetical protein
MAQSATLDPVRQRIGRKLTWGSIAVIATLTVLGQVFFLWHAAGTGTLTSASVVSHHGTFAHRVETAVSGALGASDRHVRRFRVTSIETSPSTPRLKAVRITWALNRAPSAGTVGNGGMLDAYSIARSLYTAGLPIGTVQLAGTYSEGQSKSEKTVMRLSMTRKVGRIISQAGWDTMDPQTVWPLFARQYVARGFEPLPSY